MQYNRLMRTAMPVDASSLCQRWQRWLRSFELYVGASGVTDDSQKRQLLLHCAGESVQDIFFTLADTGNTYENAKAKITSYFTPRKNTSYNRHMFRKDCQNDEEPICVNLAIKLMILSETRSSIMADRSV